MARYRRNVCIAQGPALLAVLLALAFSAPTPARPEEEAARPFGPASVLEGGPRERGLAYGKQFREAIRDFLRKEIDAAFVGRPAPKERMLDYAAACGAVVRAECPLVAEEFQGIADGAGLTFDEVVLINLHEEFYHRGDLPRHGHCTAVAVAPSYTGDGHTYVGQTWDWMRSVAGKSAVTEWRRADGVSVLAYGFPGMPAGAGVNSAGLALCWTSAALGVKGQTPRVGIPSYMLIAHLLAQKDLDGVVREARKNKHAGWFTFVVADGDGRLVNLEGSPGRVVVEPAEGRLVRVGYGCRELAGTGRDGRVKFHPRCQHMVDLLAEARGKNDLSRLQEYFAEPRYAINVGKDTIDLMVFDPTARAAYLSRGPGDTVSWRKFEFGARK
jgi:isopenicillin-N N-acyltransferase-like protein